MSPRLSWCWFFFLTACAAPSLQAAQPRPNVLMICVDDLKPTLGCYGDSVAVTPNLDALAGRGVQFNAAYCNQAVCSPSRNALMTGLRPQTLGIYDLPTHFRKAAPDAVTLTQAFMAAGYRAEGMGKIYHTGHGNINDAASWTLPWFKPKAPSYVVPANLDAIVPDGKGKKRGPATEAADVPDDTYIDGKVATVAIKRLKFAARNPDEPLFLAVGFAKPHLPFVAPQKYWDLYDPSTLPMPQLHKLPKGAPGMAGHGSGELRNYSDMPRKGPITDSQTQHLIHGYYAATSYVDAQIGRLLDGLQDSGLQDNTIVVLWGDHGWHLGDHGLWCKHTNYQQAARIPLIVAGPGVGQGESDALIETVDIYPTLTDLAGINDPPGIDGESFSAVAAQPGRSHRQYVNHVYPRGKVLGRAVRDDRYRLVQWVDFSGGKVQAVELYDYQNDPAETKNIADDEPEVVDRMSSWLAEQPKPKSPI